MDREKRIIERIIGYLNSSKKIVDIGCGKGIVTKLLRKAGKNVTAVDVKTFKYGTGTRIR